MEICYWVWTGFPVYDAFLMLWGRSGGQNRKITPKTGFEPMFIAFPGLAC